MQTVSGAPQLVPGWQDSACSTPLGHLEGRWCCTAAKLDNVTQWLAARTVSGACLPLIERIECAVGCSPELAGWWDSQRGVAHLCGSFCYQLWRECYASDRFPDPVAFCEEYHEGPGRPAAKPRSSLAST